MEWSISLLRHFKIQTSLKINRRIAAISAFRVTQHSQIFSLFFRNRIQCIALYQLYNSQALLNLRRGYYSKRAQVKNSKKAQPKAKIARTQRTKFAKKISLGLVNKGMWPENYFYCACVSITEHNKVAWGVQMSTASYNIPENKRKVVSCNIFSRKSLIAIKLHTTGYDTIQHDTTSKPSYAPKLLSQLYTYNLLLSFQSSQSYT